MLEQHHEDVLFLSNAPSAWADEICTCLTDAGYQINTVDDPEGLRHRLEVNHIDAIIAVESPENLSLLEIIRQQAHPLPLLVLVAKDVASLNGHDSQLADLIVPPIPPYIERQLQTFLSLRAEHDAIRRQLVTEQQDKERIKALEREVSRLKRELKRQQRASSEVEVLKNAIVRNVSHELKTPLLQVKSAVALIAEDAKDSKLVDYAKNATARLEALVKNITMLGSSLEINRGPVIVRDAVEYARRNLGRVWMHKNEAGRVKVTIEDGLPPVSADRQGLSTVLQLLMDNALKFSDKDIQVVARHSESGVLIEVRDKGIGIAPNQLESIFESFYQVDGSSTRRYGGAGVGLALVKLILDHHGVDIYVASEVGKGSTFSFTLPVADLR